MSKRLRKSVDELMNQLGDGDFLLDEGKVIASFDSKQLLRLNFTTSEEGGRKQIRGAVAEFQWDDIERLARVGREALARIGGCAEDDLYTVKYIESIGDYWNPKTSIVATSDESFNTVLPFAGSVITALIDCMFSSDAVKTKHIDLEMDNEKYAVVDTIASNVLTTCGGRSLSAGVNVVVAEESVAKISGKYSPRPDCSDFTVVPVDLKGVIVGFNVSSEVLFFQDEDRGQMRLAFGRVQVDLQKMTQRIETRQHIKIRTHRTLNKSGAELFAYVSLMEIGMGGPLIEPDL